MQKYLELLKNCPLFLGVNDDELISMLGCLGARVVPFAKRQTLMEEGEQAKELGVVLSGSVQIVQVDYFGNRNILSDVETGELFGEAFACAEVQSVPISVVASEAGEILFIPYARIEAPCANACGFHRQLIHNLLKIVAAKNLLFHQKLGLLSKRTTREKLTAYLLLQAKKNKSNRFSIPFDRQELADYLGVDRSGLSSELGKMRREGVLRCRKNHFELL
ncbi:MAG: Crp/Fnr family transcriptional regulator [Clostridia bacterium]|nr:Crp/Fnr family transcriptional regulator [Clostridia bacterium]